MKKILYSLLIFVSILFVSNKASALPSGSNYTNFSSNKVELARFYTVNTSVPLYGNNGISSTCGTFSEPNYNANIDCFKNGSLSLLTQGFSDSGVISSVRFLSNISMVKDNYYTATINYGISSSDYYYLKYYWRNQMNDIEIIDFYSECEDLECEVRFSFKALADSNYVWLQGNNTLDTYLLQKFSSMVSYITAVKVEEYNSISVDNKDSNFVYYDLKNENFSSVYNELSDKLEEITSILKNNTLGHKYFVYFGKNENGNFIKVALMANTASYDISNMYCLHTVNSSYASNDTFLSVTGCYSKNSYSPYDYVRYEYTENNPSSYDTLITQLRNDIVLNWNSSSFLGFKAAGSDFKHFSVSNVEFENGKYDYFKNNVYFALPYSSNVKVYNNFNGSSLKFYSYELADNLVRFRELYLEPSDNYYINVDFEVEPEPYIFDEYIEDYNYSKMIFDFDLSILEERENIFDLLLNDFYVSNEIRDSILYDIEPFEIGYPYFEYTTSSGFKGIFYLKDLDGNDITSNKIMYTGKYLYILPEDTVSLKFIVPLLDTTEYQLKVSLLTYYPFTVSYETDEEYFSYRETLVVNGKYGAIFMPKLVENNSDITTYFDTRCIDKILVYNTYDYKKDPIEVYDNMSQEFYYTILYENIDYNLFFISSTLSTCPTFNIDYDTRYFDYQIVDTKYTIGNVINPNTGQLNHIDFSNTSNIESDFDSLSGVFTFISKQLDKNNSAYLLFYDSVNTFFNTMPVDVYVLVLTVFAVILLGVTLALGGWK